MSAELTSLMRRLKLGQLLDTLPEQLALARSNRLPHHDFVEMLFANEVARRDRQSAQWRAKAAHLDPQMQLQAWDGTAAITFDSEIWAELTSLRFLADGARLDGRAQRLARSGLDVRRPARPNPGTSGRHRRQIRPTPDESASQP